MRSAGGPSTERPEQRVEYHEPVLTADVLELIGPLESGLYLDGTVGGGGHARALLEACRDCRLVAVDRDPEALKASASALEEFGDRVRFIHAGYDDALEQADLGEPLAGALLDLGVSSHQLDADPRGFAFRPGVAMDMRRDGGDPDTPTASEILNEADEADLARIFREYGEEPRARRLARQVVGRRADAPLRTSDDLVAVLARALGRSPRTKEQARIFQSLRIAVNGELDALDRALPMIRDALGSGAAMVVISYHSLEDRLVKNAFREWSRSCVCPPRIPLCTCRGAPLGSSLTRTPVRPREAEVKLNPRARSGRLRAWRKA